MQRKLNRKLLLVLSAMVVAVGGIFLIVKALGSAQALMKKGDVFASKQDFRAAFDLYRRGLHREPNNLLLLSKCASMVPSLEAESLGAALEHTRFMMQCYEQILSINPTSESAQNALLDLEYEWANSLNDPMLWQRLYERATDLIASARIMRAPANPSARRYLAIADMKRGLTVDMEEAEERIRDYLKSALLEFPDDDELTVLLANYYTAMGQRMRQQDQPVPAARFFDQAEDVLAKLTAEKDVALVRIAKARMLLVAGRLPEAFVLVRELELQLSTLTDRRSLQAASDFYRTFEEKLATAEPSLDYGSEKILGRLLELYPDRLISQMWLAEWYKSQHRFEELEHALLGLWAGQQKVRPGPVALVAASLRPAAGSELINLYLHLYEQSKDPALLEKGREILSALQAAEREDALLLVLTGKIAFAEEKYSLAAEKFIEVEARFGIKDPQVLYLMARAFWELGEMDSAQDRLLQIVKNGTITPNVCLDLSRLYVQQKGWDMAAKYADLGVKLFPESQRLASQQTLLKARMLRESGQLEDAYAILSKEPSHPSGELLLAEMEVGLGRREQAIDRLRALTDPSPSVLFLLADLTEDASVLDELESRVLSSDLFDESYQLYQYHRGRDRMTRALRFLERAVTLRPQNYKVQVAMLKNYMEFGDWSAAEKLVNRARDLNVDQVQGYAFEGQLQLARGNFDQAELAFQQAVVMRPSDSSFWKMLGDAALHAGKSSSAMEAYARAVNLRPDRLDAQWAIHRLHHLQGDYQHAADVLAKMSELSGDSGVRNAYLNYVTRYFDINRALSERKEMAAADPDNLVNQRALSAMYVQMGDLDSARTILEALNARLPRALVDVENLAMVLCEQGDENGGLALLTEYVELRGDEAGAVEWLALARRESALSLEDQADEHYLRALALDQTGIAARTYAGWLKSRNKMDEALDQFRQIKDRSGRAQDWLQYIVALLELGEQSTASAELGKYLTEHGDDTQTQIIKGLIAESDNRLEDASMAFDQAVQLSPSNPNALFQRGSFALRHLDRRSTEQAIADLKQALTFNSEMTEAREMLAKAVAASTGGEARAAMHYAEMIEQSPEHKDPYLALAKIYLSQKEYWKVESLLERARKQFPADPVWFQVEAQMWLQQGRNHDALAALRNQLAADSSLNTLQMLVRLQLRLARYDEVLSVLDEHSALAAESGLLHGARGIVLLQKGQWDEGLQEAISGLQVMRRQALDVKVLLDLVTQSITPAWQVMVYEHFTESTYDVSVVARLAELYIANREFDKVDVLLANAMKQPGERVLVLHQLSSLRVMQGRSADAVKACEQILVLEPDNLLALNNAAYLLSEKLGDADRALPYAEKAVDLGDQSGRVSAGVLDTLGMVHYRLENYEQAVFYFNRSLNVNETEAVRVHLEMARSKLPGNE